MVSEWVYYLRRFAGERSKRAVRRRLWRIWLPVPQVDGKVAFDYHDRPNANWMRVLAPVRHRWCLNQSALPRRGDGRAGSCGDGWVWGSRAWQWERRRRASRDGYYGRCQFERLTKERLEVVRTVSVPNRCHLNFMDWARKRENNCIAAVEDSILLSFCDNNTCHKLLGPIIK